MTRFEKLHWYLARWRAMRHPAEDLYRARQAFRGLLLDRFKAGAYPQAPHGFGYRDQSGIRFDRQALADLQSPQWRFQRFPLLSVTIADVGELSDWRKDHKNGRSSPLMFSGSLRAQDFSTVGDVKYVAVLSRMHFAPFYAIDAVAHDNPLSRETLKNLLADWAEQNPYLLGIHWKTGIEVGIRVLNLVMTRKILSLGKADAELFALIDRLVYACFHYLIRHPSLFSSANNHLVAELLGILVVLLHYDLPNHSRLLKQHAESFIAELFLQNNSDGGNREQSIQYLVEVLDAWITGLHLLNSSGYPADWPAISAQLSAMEEFLRHFMAADGSLSRIGDDDEGQYLYPYHDPDYEHALSTMKSLRLFSNQNQPVGNGGFDLRLYLIGGEAWRSVFQASLFQQTESAPLQSRLFADSGYAIIVGDDCELRMDVGEIGMRPLAAHGHSDLLSFTLDYRQKPLLVDPGTYQYHGRTPYRQYFRSVRAHNTVSINGLDQARSGGRMIWLQQPEIHNLRFSAATEAPFCEAEHDGFERQKTAVRHRRKIQYFRDERHFSITDQLLGEGVFDVSLAFHFHPEVRLRRVSPTCFSACNGDSRIELENPLFNSANVYRGSESPILGWYSGAYDEKVPCYTLLLPLSAQREMTMQTRIRLL